MDFNSLTQGASFYVLKKSDKPTLEVGIVKSKSEPKAAYQSQTPNIFNGLGSQQVVDVVVTIDNMDIPFNNLPVNADNTSYNNGATFVSCNREATLQAVDTMIQSSKKALEQVDYHQNVLTEGEKMLETLNPRYAEEKKQARTIRDLQERADAQDKKLDKILSRLDEFFAPPKK